MQPMREIDKTIELGKGGKVLGLVVPEVKARGMEMPRHRTVPVAPQG